MMPWKTEFLPRGAELRFSGAVTGAEILEAKAQFFAHPSSTGAPYVLCDFTAAETFDVNAGDVQRIVQQDLAAVASHPVLIEVVVAPQAHAFGLARMWELQVDEARTRTRVVHQRAEAEAWLETQGIA